VASLVQHLEASFLDQVHGDQVQDLQVEVRDQEEVSLALVDLHACEGVEVGILVVEAAVVCVVVDLDLSYQVVLLEETLVPGLDL